MYLPFKKIYFEMKYARSFPKQTITFFEIPTEIRIQIYRGALKLDSPLEFWPNLISIIKRSGRRELNLSLLRTCRKVHTEAAEVFYGENEFRFTGLAGHIVVNLFVRKIYKQHFQFIKHLTMSIPSNYDEYSDPTPVPGVAIRSSSRPVWYSSRYDHEEYEEYERNGLDDEGWWKAVGLDTNQVSEIWNLKKLAKKCTIKAAYIERRGKWVIIEGLSEDVLLPTEKEEAKENDEEGV
ncbi:hypothetical protein BKA63DRAFT_496133 [Paraphoma chrysanthemicola]|nr:hypothetical protein BKA63DRAFT_496133 [Paraphoma chrysanthemicola]